MSRNPHAPAVLPATRAQPAGWRDPRLWVGVVLVAGSVVAGSQVLAAADDTTAVWAASGDLVQGDTVTAEDLTAVQVRFTSEDDAARYVSVEDRFPSDVTLSRSLGDGELLPVAALGGTGERATIAVPLALPVEEVPGNVAAGSRVDVWILPDERDRADSARRVLEDVAVIEVPRESGAFAASSKQQVVLSVAESDDGVIAEVLAAGRTDAVRITGRGTS